jgi:hypothetical protein
MIDVSKGRQKNEKDKKLKTEHKGKWSTLKRKIEKKGGKDRKYRKNGQKGWTERMNRKDEKERKN